MVTMVPVSHSMTLSMYIRITPFQSSAGGGDHSIEIFLWPTSVAVSAVGAEDGAENQNCVVKYNTFSKDYIYHKDMEKDDGIKHMYMYLIHQSRLQWGLSWDQFQQH